MRASHVVGIGLDTLSVVVIVAGVVWVLAAMGVFGSRSNIEYANEQAEVAWFLELASEGLRRGPEDATTIIVTYHNYGCGFCRDFEDTLSVLPARYPDHLALVTKHFVADVRSGLSKIAMGAECAAEQGHFEPFHVAALDSMHLNRLQDRWLEVARMSGVPDLNVFAECVRSHRYAQVIERQFAEARGLGIDGTPGSLVNGARIVGVASVAKLDSLVAAAFPRRQSPFR